MVKLWFILLSALGLPIRKTPISGECVPEAIHHKFFRLYPAAYNISWCVYKGIYDARFVANDQSAQTFFKPNGEVYKQFKVTDIARLPRDIAMKIIKGAQGYAIVDVLVDEYHNNPRYKITFRKEKTLIETECDTQGNIISKNVI